MDWSLRPGQSAERRPRNVLVAPVVVVVIVVVGAAAVLRSSRQCSRCLRGPLPCLPPPTLTHPCALPNNKNNRNNNVTFCMQMLSSNFIVRGSSQAVPEAARPGWNEKEAPWHALARPRPPSAPAGAQQNNKPVRTSRSSSSSSPSSWVR
jgi:hypothetical protein